MALANFFDKAALSAASLLERFDYASFEEALQRQRIEVAYDTSAEQSSEGRYTLELLVNLLARLYPSLSILPLGGANPKLATYLLDLATAINPVLDTGPTSTPTVTVVIGQTSVLRQCATVYLGSDGWVAKLSPLAPIASADSRIPFGAGAAACIGAANVFRLAFGDQLPHGAPDGPLSLSLVDLVPNACSPANPSLTTTDLGEAMLVGLGAIGNAAVWALSRTPSLGGMLHLIDHQSIDLSNLQRYTLARQRDIDRAKVQRALEEFGDATVQVVPHEMPWAEFVTRRSNWHLDRVALALDSAEDRIAVQGALPRWIVNAWTQPENLGISRHDFLGGGPCVCCLYTPSGARPSKDRLYADALGFSGEQAVREIRERLHSRRPLDRAFLERVAQNRGVELEPLLAFEGAPIEVLYVRGVCGGLFLRLGGAGSERQVEVPMAFQSALAGIMLAAELVLDAGRLRTVPVAARTEVDLLRPIGRILSSPATKCRSGRCICQDADFIRAYRAKYKVATELSDDRP